MKQLKTNRSVGLVLCVLAVSALVAQSFGVDVQGWLSAHPEVLAGLSGLGFIGDTAPPINPTEIKAALDKLTGEVKEHGEKALAEASKGVNLSQAAKDKADEALTKLNEFRAQLTEVEQKLAAGTGGAPQQVKTFGELVVEDANFKTFLSERKARGSVSMSFDSKTVTSAATGALIRPRYENDILQLPRRRLTIRDLLTTVPINTSSVDYPKQLTRTNNAAPVAEGAQKPYSDFTWGNATVAVRTIAHLAKLTRQAMDDAPRLIGEVDSEMRYGLGLVEEAQLLFGDGTGQNLNGLVTQATAYVAPITVASATRVDMIRLAMLQAELALFPADGVVVNGADWGAIELTKATDGSYLFSNPVSGNLTPRLWGLPIVATPAMTIDKFLVGNFAIGATLYDRMGVEVLISTENADDFEKNLATMRAEERIALAVKRPQSFIYGDFGYVA